MKRKHLLGLLLTCATLCSMTMPVLAADLKSPELVKNSLRMLAYVQADMSSKLQSKTFERLPHENQEFQEAATPMRESVANETAEFKTKVEAQLNKALAAANYVAEVSKSNDETRIKAAIASVNDALKPLNELFPEALRPIPGQLGTGPGMDASGLPPGLR